MAAAITARGVWKQFQIGSAEAHGQSFREMLTETLMAPIRRSRRLRGIVEKDQQFWALKDLSVNIEPGEIVGIIGRNGAGKSTFLKILSRITAPTRGRIEVRGRVASLLEVGTGFHPELTGRENVWLNGAILGMKRKEIAACFEEIVEFAGVQAFLDTPVKRYSSGMRMRLAFSVAAHLDPQILLIDEVLAVGDSEFQKRCLGRMEAVAHDGRTVIFVSHNLAAIAGLCERGLVLEQGALHYDGPAQDSIEHYLELIANAGSGQIGRATAQLSLLSASSRVTGNSLQLEVQLELHEHLPDLGVEVGVNNATGQRIFTVHSRNARDVVMEAQPGRRTYTCELDIGQLKSGQYDLKLSFDSGDAAVVAVEGCAPFVFGNPADDARLAGVVAGACTWRLHHDD